MVEGVKVILRMFIPPIAIGALIIGILHLLGY